MSRRQQRRRIARRRAHVVAAGGGLAVIASLSTGSVAQAASHTYTVSNLSDCATIGCGSLRAAIDAVNADTTDTSSPGDAIVFASGLSGTIALSGSELDLTSPAQIYGPGANLVTVQAATGDRALYTDANATVSGLKFVGGAPASTDKSGNGGGILADNTLTLNGVAVTGNVATGQGGGVDDRGGTLNINHSTINGNTAASEGGGVYAYDDSYTSNSTVAGNTAPNGAGISSDDFATVTGSTVAGNNPTGAGGQIHQINNKYFTLQDSIVAGNGSAADIAIPSGVSMDIGYSLIRNPSSAGAGDEALTTDATDITGLDPKLGPLQDNGGATLTMVPLAGSPALDRGKSFGLTRDQRNLPRPFALPTVPASVVPGGGDRSDIGSVEEETPSIAAISPKSGGSGTTIAIAGTGFTGATQVLFGSTPATSFTVLGDGAMTAVAPVNAQTQDVRVITPLGESPVVSADQFTFPTFTPIVSKPRAKRSGSTVNTGIKVSCPSGGLGCSGTFKATGYLKHVNSKIAHGSLSLSAGHSKTLSFKLGSKALKQLKSAGKLKITIQIVIADGSEKAITANRTITLTYKVKKKHQH